VCLRAARHKRIRSSLPAGQGEGAFLDVLKRLRLLGAAAMAWDDLELNA